MTATNTSIAQVDCRENVAHCVPNAPRRAVSEQASRGGKQAGVER